MLDPVFRTVQFLPGTIHAGFPSPASDYEERELNASKKCMRRCDRRRERKVVNRRKRKELTKPLTVPLLDEEALAELRRRYDKSPDAETRTRYQMLLLALQGQKSGQIAHTVWRSQDTVERVLKRFLAGGLDAVPRRTAEGASTNDHGREGAPSCCA